MNILIIGNGGREHAIAWKIAEDTRVANVFIAPGNAGTNTENKCQNIEIDVLDFDKLAKFAKENKAITIVGPEAPLAAGIVDYFQRENLPIFGPKQNSAILESSKAFTKAFLKRNNIPTADYEEFTDFDVAVAYIQNYSQNKTFPLVLKADGLAAGKGVIIANNENEAIEALKEMMLNDKFLDAGKKVVIEDFISGEEASFIVVAKGLDVIALATSQDHKRAKDNDEGENTGGMGAYSPASIVDAKMHAKIMQEIIHPTLQAMKNEGREYSGFLYAGLMIENEQPKVIEFNCRLGDPETQPLLFRMESSLLELIESVLDDKLNNFNLIYKQDVSLAVVLAAKGYPDDYEKGAILDNLIKFNQNNKDANIKVFQAGTKQVGDKIIVNGGRVLAITVLSDTIKNAHTKAYEALEKIKWETAEYRTDIGFRAINR